MDQLMRRTAYSGSKHWNVLNLDWWDLMLKEHPSVEFTFKSSGANRSLEATWGSWVAVKWYSIKKAERFFPLQKALLLHHGYQSLIFDFIWPFSIKNMIATVRVTDPGRESTTLSHTPTHPTGRYIPCLLECAGPTVPFPFNLTFSAALSAAGPVWCHIYSPCSMHCWTLRVLNEIPKGKQSCGWVCVCGEGGIILATNEQLYKFYQKQS